jgi:flagellar motility protein MotE (MotC chaperone)/biotin operon repressor
MSDVGKPFHTTLSDPVVQHGFLHSKIMQAIEGKSDQYVQPVDADGNPTGAPVNQPKQNSPGFFFRNLLAGVLAGAASGAGHGVAGAGMGWNAATEMQDKARARAHDQAQEQWQNQRQATEDAQKADTAYQQKLVSQAQIKMYQHNIIESQHTMDFEDQGRIDKINDSTRVIMDTLEARGAQDPKDLPPIMNFYALRDKVVETKGAALHPDNDPTEQNSHRIFVDTITGDQEKWDPDQNAWTDQTTGKPMDKTANTNVRIYDVPVDSMTKLFPMDKAQVNKLAGETVFPNPEGTVNMSLDRVIGLGNQFRAQQNMNRANTNASREQGEREYKDLFDLTKAQNDELLKQQKELQPTDPNYKALQTQMDDGWKAVVDKYHELHPGTKKKKEDIVNPPPPPDAPSSLLLGKMQQDDKIQPGTPDAYRYITSSNLKPEDQQAALRDSKTPMPWIRATEAADQLIAKTPMSREAALRKVIQQAQEKGITVAPRPTDGRVMSPYPNLNSSNVTTSASR